MAIEIKAPSFPESVADGTVATWHKKPGDAVKRDDLIEVLAPYKNVKHIVWCQEEPMNQGAWYCSQHHMRRIISGHDKSLVLEYAGRDASAAPACGYASMHAEQQEKLLQDAFTV